MKEVALSRWRSRDYRDAVPTEASANFPGILEAGMDDLSESTLCWSVVGCGHDLGRGVLFSQGSLLKAVLLSFQHLQGEEGSPLFLKQHLSSTSPRPQQLNQC